MRSEAWRHPCRVSRRRAGRNAANSLASGGGIQNILPHLFGQKRRKQSPAEGAGGPHGVEQKPAAGRSLPWQGGPCRGTELSGPGGKGQLLRPLPARDGAETKGSRSAFGPFDSAEAGARGRQVHRHVAAGARGRGGLPEPHTRGEHFLRGRERGWWGPGAGRRGRFAGALRGAESQ